MNKKMTDVVIKTGLAVIHRIDSADVTLARCAVARFGHMCTRINHLNRLECQQMPFPINRSTRYSKNFFHNHSRLSSHDDKHPNLGDGTKYSLQYGIPHRVRQKVISASDAAALVRDNDTICVSGFLCQGAPEAVLKALGERYSETSSPNRLTLLFGGGVGDGGHRGLNHLAKTREAEHAPPMLRRTVGSLYRLLPKIVQLALSNVVEAWTLPLGSISRMIRAQSTHSPGHITTVGLGTYVDPDMSGGAANEAARKSKLHKKLVRKININGHVNLLYRALPINVAIIRGTTADAQGNISLDGESLLCDQKIIATAAKNSGGLVIAQVKQLAASGSLPSRKVAVPGALVDCVVVVDEEDHDTLHEMSFDERYNPALVGQLVTPRDEMKSIALSTRKIIARRAFFCLEPNKNVNLGIGLPEDIASVANEEGMLDFVNFSTEPGVFGGLMASGRSFGPALNASAVVETNQMFDCYDGGLLDMSFLGAAQISKSGDVNVSRMSNNEITGPGGFIDISQSTRSVCFLTPMTAKGLKVFCPGDGTLEIETEGSIKKFVPEVFEKTFSGDEAVRRGQQVLFVTERAVFRRTFENEVIELIEIAPGIDLEKDVLDQMHFAPAISSDLKKMDPRIFLDTKMNISLFGSLEERCTYHVCDHTMFLNLFGITLNSKEDILWFHGCIAEILKPIVKSKGPINMVVQYDGFDVHKGLERFYGEGAAILQKKYYKTVRRYCYAVFHRAQLAKQLHISKWDRDKLFGKIDFDHDGRVSLEEVRNGIARIFNIHLTPSQLEMFQKRPSQEVDRETFAKGVEEVLRTIAYLGEHKDRQ